MPPSGAVRADREFATYESEFYPPLPLRVDLMRPSEFNFTTHLISDIPNRGNLEIESRRTGFALSGTVSASGAPRDYGRQTPNSPVAESFAGVTSLISPWRTLLYNSALIYVSSDIPTFFFSFYAAALRFAVPTLETFARACASRASVRRKERGVEVNAKKRSRVKTSQD